VGRGDETTGLFAPDEGGEEIAPASPQSHELRKEKISLYIKGRKTELY